MLVLCRSRTVQHYNRLFVNILALTEHYHFVERLCYDIGNDSPFGGTMNKIAQYLNEHILGEVATDKATREAFSHDASVLAILPEMVVYPRVTNDIRKIARFSWQLADKGHTLPLTVRGGGSDTTGGSIGKGVIVNTTAHMNAIFELDAKQRLIRLQPGVIFKTLNDALALHGLQVPSYPVSAAYGTIGGAIANNASGILSGKYGGTATWINQLEVVLANGDVLQTGRMSKRELNRKKGLQTFEGEIYRQIDNLIDDNAETIAKVIGDTRDNVGYSGIGDVKRRDGSFDLAPLIAGSQGTLGVISEVIMKAELLTTKQTVALAIFDTSEQARDAIDAIIPADPSILEFIDGRLFEAAAARGKKYDFQSDTERAIGAALLFAFDDPSERIQKKKLKKLRKAFEPVAPQLIVAEDEQSTLELLSVRNVVAVASQPETDAVSAPPLLEGAYIPAERFEEFTKALNSLADKYRMQLPLYGHGLESIYHVRPLFDLSKVSERQKVIKLLSDYSTLVAAHGGHLIGQASEGRLKAPFAHKELEDDVKQLYKDIKAIFDPGGILNPGVKEPGDLKQLIAAVRSDYASTHVIGGYSE